MTGIQLIDYDIAVDVQRDASGLITSGLVLGDILHQNQALILVLHKGVLKSAVSVGVGIDRMLLDNERLTWTREIREQLEMDGQKVEDVRIRGKQIIIKAAY
jgi:predicted proteasome-type protease